MRTTALAILLCLSSGMVDAQTTEQCHSLKGAGDLIACYDGTVPSSAPTLPRRSKPAAAQDSPVISEPRIAGAKATASKASTKQDPYFDVLEAENSKLDAKMKTLCRGC
jgi:hypothetical protein